MDSLLQPKRPLQTNIDLRIGPARYEGTNQEQQRQDAAESSEGRLLKKEQDFKHSEDSRFPVACVQQSHL